LLQHFAEWAVRDLSGALGSMTSGDSTKTVARMKCWIGEESTERPEVEAVEVATEVDDERSAE